MAQPWYTYPSDIGAGQYGSYPDPMGNFAKPDINVCAPSSVPITAIMSGVVTDVSWNKAWSASVTVKLDVPPNSFAQYCAYNFLTQVAVGVGQRINIGTLIGYPGKPVCMAFGLTNASPWGAGYFGRTADPRLDPRPIIQAAQAGLMFQFGSRNFFSSFLNGFSSSTPGQTFQSVSLASHDTLNNIPGFDGIVEALDIAEQFQPFQLPDGSGSIIGKIPIIGSILAPITIPADAMQAFLTFITANALAAIIRLTVMFIGLMIIIALIRNAVNTVTVETTGQTPGQLAGSAVKIGAAVAAL